jgi:glycosyltransferase involved in cell wall biosynthesis
MTISVLYIHHVGVFGGASRSLLELTQGFPRDTVDTHLVLPHGNVAQFFAAVGAHIITTAGLSQFDNTRYGYYRGKRWLLLLREAYFALFTVLSLLRARRQWPGIELVHVNDITALLPIIVARKLFKRPVVVHVRSVMRAEVEDWRRRLVTWVVHNYCDCLIAIDLTVKKSLPAGLDCEVVHNSFSPDVTTTHEQSAVEIRLKQLSTNGLKVAIVGNLLPLKGIYEFIEAAALCARKGVKAQFIIVGGNTRNLTGIKGAILRQSRFVRDVEADIKNAIAAHNLHDCVHLFDFTADIQSVYRNIDVICFPSHLNAVGRPVYEAAFSKVPSIVAIEDPLPDTMLPGETGLCIRAKDPQSLADAVEYFARRPEEVKRMGEAAYLLAHQNFDRRANAARVLEIYRQVTDRYKRTPESPAL